MEASSANVDPSAIGRRLLIGEAPWRFLLEVLLRVAIVYLALVAVMRLFGKRLSGHIGNWSLPSSWRSGPFWAARCKTRRAAWCRG